MYHPEASAEGSPWGRRPEPPFFVIPNEARVASLSLSRTNRGVDASLSLSRTNRGVDASLSLGRTNRGVDASLSLGRTK
jgi:hypothetical protein